MKKIFLLLVLALALWPLIRGKPPAQGCTGLCAMMIAQLEASSAAGRQAPVRLPPENMGEDNRVPNPDAHPELAR